MDISKKIYIKNGIWEKLYLIKLNIKDIQDFKKGFIYDEVILKPIDEIQLLLQNLIEAGYQIAIATGRPRTETIIPFQSLGLKSYFKDEHIVTASEVLLAEKQFPQYQPLGKLTHLVTSLL